MKNLAKVIEHEELRKDMNSGAILLSDNNVAGEYKTRKVMLKSVNDVSNEINKLKEQLSEIDNIKNDMREIKELLRGLAK